MGRIRTKFIKSMAKELVERYPDKFGVDFELNKQILNELGILDEKSIRNKVAGYICKIVKKRT